MQQRQPRLGDILDDYCPRERRLTNHVVVAMIGDAVKQTRCTTCDADHEYKHAAMPRQRKKSDQSTLYSQVLAGVTPKKITHVDSSMDTVDPEEHDSAFVPESQDTAESAAPEVPQLLDVAPEEDAVLDDDHDAGAEDGPVEEGPAHRRLIRAQLPRHEGQVSTARQPTDFTIRQPTPPRAKRFGARNQRGPGASGAQFQGNRAGGGNNGNGNGGRNGAPRPGGRPQGGGGQARPNRQGGRNRPK